MAAALFFYIFHYDGCCSTVDRHGAQTCTPDGAHTMTVQISNSFSTIRGMDDGANSHGLLAYSISLDLLAHKIYGHCLKLSFCVQTILKIWGGLAENNLKLKGLRPLLTLHGFCKNFLQ
jgi:hypothetical protein